MCCQEKLLIDKFYKGDNENENVQVSEDNNSNDKESDIFSTFFKCMSQYEDEYFIYDWLKRVLLNRVPTSIHFHPDPPSSIHLPLAPSSLFQPPLSCLQYPQQYLNQNIARNWAISPNLGQKFKNCPFWQKIGTHGILEVVIPNPDLDFWNSDTKIHF